MSKVIGVWLVMDAIIILIGFGIGSCELDIKDVVRIVLLLSVFITMVIGGACLITG